MKKHSCDHLKARFDIHAFVDADLYGYGTCLSTTQKNVEEITISLLDDYSAIVAFFNQASQA